LYLFLPSFWCPAKNLSDVIAVKEAWSGHMGRITSYFLFILFYSCTQVLIAQSHPKSPSHQKIDSLFQVISTLKEDTNKIHLQNTLAQLLFDSGEFSKVDSLARETLKLADKLNDKKCKGDACNQIGLVFLNKGNYAQAREYFFKALAQDWLIANNEAICRRTSNVGITYEQEHDFLISMRYHMEALQVAESLKDRKLIAVCYNNMGTVLIKQEKYRHALNYFLRSLSINQNQLDKGTQYISLSSIGRIYEDQGDYVKALNYNSKALKIAEGLRSETKIEQSVSSLGRAYTNLGNYPKALSHYFKALQMAEEKGNQKEISNVLRCIGSNYLDQGDKERGAEYLLKGFTVIEATGDKESIAGYLGNLGTVYMEKRDTLKALSYFLQAVKINKGLGIKSNMHTWLNNIAKIYEIRSKLDPSMDSSQINASKALTYYLEALKNAEERMQKDEIIHSCFLIGSFYNSKSNLKYAETYLKKGLQLSIASGEILNRKNIHGELSDLYEKQKRYQLEMEHYKKYIALRDSIFNKENTKNALRTELNFEFEKKQSLEKAEQEKRNVVIASERKRQRIVLLFVSGFALLILLGSIVMYRSYSQKQRINNELHVRSQRIEIAHRIIKEKNDEITDSINYALHIQQAMLPDKEEIFNVLPQSFVLFKPKDIVSGDFYFFTHFHEKIFIATADCTGHGVPGGFMSMIGSEKLNYALKQSSDPGKILSFVNEGIKRSLHQSGNTKTNRDGMDISLCSIDLKNRSVEFAGANRPIWIIRKNGMLLEEIKGTKASIGGLTEDDKTFDTHYIQLKEGDTFYICSDGYADQFGLNDNKKLTSRIFKNILFAIKDKSMEEQGQFLDDFIADWRGSIEQTDDILLVGIRI
jgi:tetratricopeptide (TPR) repeat protein